MACMLSFFRAGTGMSLAVSGPGRDGMMNMGATAVGKRGPCGSPLVLPFVLSTLAELPACRHETCSNPLATKLRLMTPVP